MLNNAGLNLIKEYEGLKLTQYYCPSNISTIGYGTTRIKGQPVPKGLKITKEQAEAYLIDDVRLFEQGVSRLLNVDRLTPNQYAALVSFAYNCGLGNLKSSTLLKKVKANPNDPSIANEFNKWTRSNGVVLKGLQRRRKSEADLYFSE